MNGSLSVVMVFLINPIITNGGAIFCALGG
jgi:hypothetical protein